MLAYQSPWHGIGFLPCGQGYAGELFELSSLLPQIYNERIARMKSIPMDKRLVAMSVNADMQQLVKIMDIGTPTNIQQQ